jgi:hypothetical protein
MLKNDKTLFFSFHFVLILTILGVMNLTFHAITPLFPVETLL